MSVTQPATSKAILQIADPSELGLLAVGVTGGIKPLREVGTIFRFQFNPTNMIETMNVNYKEDEVISRVPPLQYIKGGIRIWSFSFLLSDWGKFESLNDLFNTSEGLLTKNFKSFTQKALSFLRRAASPLQGDLNDAIEESPSTLNFLWNGESFRCVITKLKIDTVAWDSVQGFPIRAFVDLTLREVGGRAALGEAG